MTKIKTFISNEWKTFRTEIPTIEYIIWWLMRIALIVVLINIAIEDIGDIRVLQISGNLLATFAVPLLRTIFNSPKSIFRKLPFRCQSWINVTAFMASFFGQGLDWYHEITSWDKFIHFVTGGTVVLIGNELVTMMMKKDDKISATNRTFSAMGFSFFAMVIWELIEFFFDYFIVSSALQRYDPSDIEDCANNLFTKIFGQSVNEGRIEDGIVINHWPVFDTNMDLFYATVCCFIVGVGLYIFYKKKEKKENLITEK